MQHLKFIAGMGFTLVIVAGVGAAYIYAGALDVAASTPHNAFEQSLFRTAMRRSVMAMSRRMSQPPRFTDDMVKDGFEHYEDMCAGCHGGPGINVARSAKVSIHKRPILPMLFRHGRHASCFGSSRMA